MEKTATKLGINYIVVNQANIPPTYEDRKQKEAIIDISL